ncbi:MAG: secretin and TonB N-terminal domain-containing protein [Armatimonadetes bacterium]|nr:secretin and TonB N-terminal domain-containing protein [Armatimonadota bacterium]
MALLALALTSSAFAAPTLENVTFQKVGDGVEVVVAGRGLSKPTELWQKEIGSYTLEFDATLGPRAKNLNVSVAGVSSVTTAWHTVRPPKVRVVFKVTPEAKPVLFQAEGGWVVAFNTTSFIRTTDTRSELLEKPAPVKKAELSDPTKPAPKPETKPVTNLPVKDPIQDILDRPQVQQPLDTVASNTKSKPKSEDTKQPLALAKPKARVSLDFVNADVTQILKAVALQADANIVTAPDLKGQITLKLDNVTVEEALDLVTALSGLRYANVNNTYVVAPKDKFAEVVRALNKSESRAAETRVVPIYSGEGEQIRAAVTRAYPTDSGKGTFEIILPTESGVTVEKVDGNTEEAGEGSKKAPPTKPEAGTPVGSQFYLMLVGNPAALDVAEELVKNVDHLLCNANGIQIPDTSVLEQDVYFIQSEDMSAKSLMDAVVTYGGKQFRNVQFIPTPGTSDRQAIYLIGRANDVTRAKDMLAKFDGSQDIVYAYDVHFGDPRSLRDELMANVPGLRVTIPAGSALNPRVYEAPKVKKGGSGDTGGSGADSGSGGGGATGSSNVNIKGETAEAEGLTQPFSDLEKISKPMRLVLRGTPDQIEKAKSYLGQVDVAPKQVAIDLRVVEMSREDALRIGLDWSLFTGGVVRLIRVNQGLGDTAATAGTINRPENSTATTPSGRDSSSILGTLDQIANSRKLVARPNFLAIDGRESEFFVGDVVRYIESIQSTQNGITVTTNSVRVGVRCAVHVRVGAEKSIMMDLRPVVSYLRGFTAVPGGGQLPQTSERIAQNSLVMNSGETLAIGGLIRDEDRKIVSGIPILKDLPIVGKLFSRTDNLRTRTEIVIFLTAKVVDANDRMEAAVPRANAQRDTYDPTTKYPDPTEKPKKAKTDK